MSRTKGSRKAAPVSQPPTIASLERAIADHELVVVVGTGVSLGLTNNTKPELGWKGLIRNGLEHAKLKGKVRHEQASRWASLLDSDDLDDLLGAAEFVGRKLDGPSGDLYSRWLEGVFRPVAPQNEALSRAVVSISQRKIPICTLNYDTLLEQVTNLESVTIEDAGKMVSWTRRELNAVAHLHGVWMQPSSCVLGIRDYEKTLSSEARSLFQRTLATFRRLLFVGCGDTFADPNFSALIRWLRGNMQAAAPQHYALVRNAEVAARHADPTWHGFVEPIGFGDDHAKLPDFLLDIFGKRSEPRAITTSRLAKPRAVRHDTVLDEYRAFVLRDCGQMTIEGLRADMDTAQRRFDLERLFVPLDLLPCPPEIPESDPDRKQKLDAWHKWNKKSLSFGRVFKTNRHIALLALPGGGKTLLLKRLAVAYSSGTRLRASDDALPAIEVVPVIIKCREWREHIHRPIMTLLSRVSEIAGVPSLTGLADALTPHLKAGKVLLLVDGLDEIHDDALRATFVEHLTNFLEEFPQTRLVVTSREAGFGLVAPSLARFCSRWRIAPLNEGAIGLLCRYWHELMVGDLPHARQEGKDVASMLIRNESLRRLAENPLLLTMLLVVKHGAGRLPPDRVSLYGRAVEILLDTWNIKGHDPLNLKEAVPQLAAIAYHLMRQGKQTATEKELLAVLEEARERLPQIRRYAKDRPDQFLRRVELRSSLLVEAGKQVESGRTVAFYQFRHLTFQEYLAAVAAVEGYYLDYDKADTLLTPLGAFRTSPEWKEVIPMAVVLARKQAEPLVAALVDDGNALRRALENDGKAKIPDWSDSYYVNLPAPVARLMQCFVEEAEASPETITSALLLVVFFAKGCRSNDDWTALIRGPFGDELWKQAWCLFAQMRWPEETWLLNTCAVLLVRRFPPEHWSLPEVQRQLASALRSPELEVCAKSLLTWVGILWDSSVPRSESPEILNPVETELAEIERLVLHSSEIVWAPALWIYAYFHHRRKSFVVSCEVWDRIASIWLHSVRGPFRVSYPLTLRLGLHRYAWSFAATPDEVAQIRRVASQGVHDEERNSRAAALFLAFHATSGFSDGELAQLMRSYVESRRDKRDDYTLEGVSLMMAQLRVA